MTGSHRQPEGLGVKGRGIHFRSPSRRNLAHRLETQFLAQALLQPEASEKTYKKRETGELRFIINFLRGDQDGSSHQGRGGSRVKHGIIETESMQAEREKQVMERKNWTTDFLDTYLHWLRWNDSRNSRLADNVRRNETLKSQNKRATNMRYHDVFFPTGTNGMTDKKQARAMSETVGEVVLHRIVASTKSHIRRSITRVANQQRAVRRKRLFSTPECEEQKFRHLNTFGNIAQLTDSKGRIALGNLVDPNMDKNQVPVNANETVATHPDNPIADLPTSDLLCHPLPGCEPCNAFQEIFIKGLASKGSIQKGLLSLVKTEFAADLNHSLKDFSLSDPPQPSHTGSEQPGVLHKYVEKWNQRARRVLTVPPIKTERFTLFDEDPTTAGNFSSKDVTADFSPVMLFEKAKEKENIYSSMAGRAAEVISRRLAFSNWPRTSSDDVRLTDLQEWSGVLLANGLANGPAPADWNRRVRWLNGPPYFGHGAQDVIRELKKNQATCGMENVQHLANTMAEHLTQENIAKKFVLLDELGLPKPQFYRSSPPWLSFINVEGLAKGQNSKPVKKIHFQKNS